MPDGPPLVSVVMSVFDGEAHLAESVESILEQTERDLELIVVDDGSSDDSGEILKRLSRRDPRLRPLRSEVNLGQATALNSGLEAAGGRYIARMDADDVAEPERLATQVAWLERNPDVGLLGSAVRLVAEGNRPEVVRERPETDLEIRWTSLLDNPFMHPTVMIRRDVLERHALRYDQSLRTTQDYDLWTRLLTVTQAANLPEPLVRYRRPAAKPSPRREDQLTNHDRIALRAIEERLPGFAIDLPQVTGLRAFFVGGREITPVGQDDRLPLCRLYLRLATAFLRRHRGEPHATRVREMAAATVARALRRTAIRRGWLVTALRIIALNPRLARSLLGHWRRRGD